jgi:hypothetical protein
MTTKNTLLQRIAAQYLELETLETRNADDLDFHDLAVWAIREALEAAYQAGVEAAAQGQPKQQPV